MQGSWRAVTAAEQSAQDADAAMAFGRFAPNAVQRVLIAPARATILKRGVFRASITRLILALGRGPLDIRKDDFTIVARRESRNGHLPVWSPATILCNAGVGPAYAPKIDIEAHEDRARVPSLGARGSVLLPRLVFIEHMEPRAAYSDCTSAFPRHGYRLMGPSCNNSPCGLMP